MSAKPGQSFSTTIQTSNIEGVKVTSDGHAVAVDAAKTPSGQYSVKIDGGDVICPGPIRISDGEELIQEVVVEPCPQDV